MAKIYTSYFANLRNLPDNVCPISICGKAPDWYTGIQYKALAPKYWFFKKYKEATKDQEKEIANKILYARGRQKEQSNAIVEMS